MFRRAQRKKFWRVSLPVPGPRKRCCRWASTCTRRWSLPVRRRSGAPRPGYRDPSEVSGHLVLLCRGRVGRSSQFAHRQRLGAWYDANGFAKTTAYGTTIAARTKGPNRAAQRLDRMAVRRCRSFGSDFGTDFASSGSRTMEARCCMASRLAGGRYGHIVRASAWRRPEQVFRRAAR